MRRDQLEHAIRTAGQSIGADPGRPWRWRDIAFRERRGQLPKRDVEELDWG
jgi:hypothetical protein